MPVLKCDRTQSGRDREAPSPHKNFLQRKPQVQGSHLQTSSCYGFQMEKMAAMPGKQDPVTTNQIGGIKKGQEGRTVATH